MIVNVVQPLAENFGELRIEAIVEGAQDHFFFYGFEQRRVEVTLADETVALGKAVDLDYSGRLVLDLRNHGTHAIRAEETKLLRVK